MKEFIIKPNEANQRFDKYLKKLLPNATGGFLYKMLRKKNITCNNAKATGNEILAQGDIIKIFLSDETFEKFSKDPKALQGEYEALKKLTLKGLQVVYEDEDILVVNKPANMLSQKAEPKDISANERILGYLIQKGELDFDTFLTFRPSICNRLDRNTTGLLLAGKSLKGLQALSEDLKNRDMKKFYRAVVCGEVKDNAYLKGYLWKDEARNQVKITEEQTREDASYIETSYEVIKSTKDHSILEIHLITGKTHQIRAHLASIGHPIIGDLKYGRKDANEKYKKLYQVDHQLLHAYRVEFPKGLTLTAPEPKEFARF